MDLLGGSGRVSLVGGEGTGRYSVENRRSNRHARSISAQTVKAKARR
jgi:hypothetical protein